jgi:hypothetical protein
MKTTVPFLFAAALSLAACMPTARVTGSGSSENYLKNIVEKHHEGEFSHIRSCQFFNGPALNGGALEFLGYKYLGGKNLIIAATVSSTVTSTSPQAKATTVSGTSTYIQLTEAQVRLVIANNTVLDERIRKEKPVAGETVYHDFTASPDLFVSYSRAYGSFAGQAGNYVHLWIGGDKYTLSSADMIRRLESFLAY